jgi:phosphoadenosine phosphosulfate reductase
MLFLAERIAESVEILRMYEPPEGYYLAFSGGKDSIVLYAMAQEAGVKFDAHYHITTADPPELIRFIKSEYPGVSMVHPEETMWQLVVRKCYPPTRLARFCCEVLKEGGGENRVVLTGVKHTDSSSRRKWFVKSCQKKGKIVVNPLLNWCDDEIWAYIHENNIPYCSLYDEGLTRLGCVGCPLAGPDRQRKDFERWPKIRLAWLHAFDRMLEERKRRGKETQWQTAEEVMSWWLKEDLHV